MLGGLPHLVVESYVYRVIGEFECLPRQSLLVPIRSQGRQSTGSLERLLIYDRRPARPRTYAVRLRRLTS